jgi:hypothetical protein
MEYACTGNVTLFLLRIRISPFRAMPPRLDLGHGPLKPLKLALAPLLLPLVWNLPLWVTSLSLPRPLPLLLQLLAALHLTSLLAASILI